MNKNQQSEDIIEVINKHSFDIHEAYLQNLNTGRWWDLWKTWGIDSYLMLKDLKTTTLLGDKVEITLDHKDLDSKLIINGRFCCWV